MDEQAFPIVLAWQLQRFDAATWRKLRRTAEFIVRHGPETEQDRWENQSGYSPGTIAAEIAGLVVRRRPGAPQRRDGRRRALRARRRPLGRQPSSAGRRPQRPVLRRALLPAAHQGPPAGPRHALQHRRRRPGAGRPAQGRRPELPRARAARRQAVRRPGDPQHARGRRPAAARRDAERRRSGTASSTTATARRRTGGGWRLTKEGSRQTFGRLWPIFAGERGEYELLAGRPADAHLKAIADAGNDGGMIPEQVWDGRAADAACRRARGPSRRPRSRGRTRSSSGWPGRSTPEPRSSSPRSSPAGTYGSVR